MLYCLFTSAIFRKSTLDELKKVAKFRVVDESVGLLIIETGMRDLRKAAERLVFTYSAFPLTHVAGIGKKNYLRTIERAIRATMAGKKEALRLECVDINMKEGLSAKDIEVRIGQKLEKEGFSINLADPERLAYVILLNNKCYSGAVDCRGLRLKFVNPMRYYHTRKSVSRSELKLREAFDYFGIRSTGIAIDLGAAPGGWSGFLAQRGFKVIAIDKGNLDIDSLSESKTKTKSVTAKKRIDGLNELEKVDILHVKDNFANAAKALKIKNVDLLADDMNVDAKRTAAAVRSYLKFLKKDAELLITVKCITRYAPRAIGTAEREIGKYATILGMKVLPNNRQEITLYASLRR